MASRSYTSLIASADKGVTRVLHHSQTGICTGYTVAYSSMLNAMFVMFLMGYEFLEDTVPPLKTSLINHSEFRKKAVRVPTGTR